MTWVAQREDWDCGVAVLAMLTGESYEAVRAVFAPYEPYSDGLQPSHMTKYLWDRGYFTRTVVNRSYARQEIWPPLAFAPMHFLMVKSPTGPGGHWVAMDAQDGVLDPFDPTRNGRRPDFYGVCYMAFGVVPPSLWPVAEESESRSEAESLSPAAVQAALDEFASPPPVESGEPVQLRRQEP